ncbi:YdeI/OmpD-associated family protein [Pedobacter aquatilis]|uniref:YdeI/OmpD-associated family protein n=1 Tax=Pedobacter aquatilis TaxID=351343 RepID=UPI00293196A1|nr:YdeI/OmpD-associated family protein [Pedobacter aquatilis]
MADTGIETFYPTSRQAWRNWLIKNHESAQAVWLLSYKKSANMPTITWEESVEEALCFGWIDSIRKSLGDGKFIQFFSKRKPNGTWSKINKDKIIKLIEAGLMTDAGLVAIEKAKQNGSWTILDEVEALIVPADLEQAFAENPNSMEFYLSLSKSTRKAILQWIVLAKQPETRQKRIKEVAERASQNLKPKHL